MKQKRSTRTLKRILNHPLAIWGLLVTGVIISGLTVIGGADSYTLQATVPAPALSEPAVITSPEDNAVISSIPTTVSGTCPNNSYVNLLRDGNFSGSDVCSSANTFSISSDLSAGQNVLQAQDYNITNMAGPSSESITVTYQPPVIPPSGQGQPSSPIFQAANVPSAIVTPSYDNNGHGPLLLTTQYLYLTALTNQPLTPTLSINGGTAPYFVSINWGDKNTSNLFFDSSQSFTPSHVYKQAATFPILVEVIDTRGVKVVLQISVVISKKVTPLSAGTINLVNSTPFTLRIFANTRHWLKVIWPVYGVVTLMSVSFLLGEHEKYLELLKVLRIKNH